MKICSLILLLALSISVFSQNGMDYYSAGMNAYTLGNYKEALEWFEKALELDPTIEQTDPYLKLRMGICAFMVKDFQKAKTYLSLYKDNEVAQQMLKVIEKGMPEEEWKKWLKIPQETPQATETTVEKKRNFKSILLPLGISIVVFVSLFLIELKIMKLRELTKLAKQTEQPKEAASVEVPETPQKASEGVVEVPFEEIMRKEIEAVEELVQPMSSESEGETEETKEEISVELAEKEGEMESEKTERTEIHEVRKAFEKIGREEETEEFDEDKVIERAKELLENESERMEGISIEEANLDPERVFEELEEKDTYDDEDARMLVLALKKSLQDE
ncbi:MAG: tetratricopeptide repeat protein [Thermotogaceae bacterium]|nr:tetratricopeptide repeat protein [Thermotogaceae bacterium]